MLLRLCRLTDHVETPYSFATAAAEQRLATHRADLVPPGAAFEGRPIRQCKFAADAHQRQGEIHVFVEVRAERRPGDVGAEVSSHRNHAVPDQPDGSWFCR